MFTRRSIFTMIAGAGSLLLGASPALAQPYPTKQPIKIVVGFAPGGLTDTLARITAEFLGRRLGQTVVVENRPGATGAIAMDYVSKSPADGYTLYYAAPELTITPALRSDLPYKFENFTFLMRTFTTTPLILASPNFPASSTQELIAYMKANPGKVRMAIPGIGNFNHLAAILFVNAVGAKVAYVPYQGAGPIYPDLTAGHVDVYYGGDAFAVGPKIIGNAGAKRHPLHPQLPTLAELGYKNAGHDGSFSIVAPPNLPRPIAEQLVAALNAVYTDPAVIARFESGAKVAPEKQPLTFDAFKKWALEDHKTWRQVVQQEKIVVQ